jgi:hypothetical protein
MPGESRAGVKMLQLLHTSRYLLFEFNFLTRDEERISSKVRELFPKQSTDDPWAYQRS